MKYNTAEKRTKEFKDSSKINYYVVASIFIAIILYDIANAMVSQIDSELDFFELTKMLEFSLQARCQHVHSIFTY
ncbi:MAG TPA: hypothetical protein VFU67_05050 [Nitrososphaeraceae archaeon]|nr:hypothetical protein [Nitrososphaeraceae archaeon]